MRPKPWYETGLRFACTRSGRCCRNHGAYTRVYLARRDVAAIAAHLGLEPAAFLERYCRREDGWTILRMDRPACLFLAPGGECSIYPVRPKQCATWPFWSENLDPRVWNASVAPFCPGVGRGRLHSRAEIERIARETDAWYEAD
ncbi:MAG: YkgJ family cysteine cluster protein [Planctomycetota bacterium]